MAKSIDAYEFEQRVARYDADMDLMHPNRHKMVSIALELLPYPSDTRLTGIDLGVGTGYFSARFLERFPHSRILGLDGSSAMLDLARTRLAGVLNRIDLVKAELDRLSSLSTSWPAVDVVFSSYTLHHLKSGDKLNLFSDMVKKLSPGGWFLNADLISNPFPEIDSIIQDLRAKGVCERNAGSDPRFSDVGKIHQFIRDLEENEEDQPLTIDEDLGLMRQAGLSNASIFWQEYREAVYGGCTPL